MFNIQQELSKKKSEVTFTKLVITLASVAIFFVSPCIAINSYLNEGSKSQNTSEVKGEVAGVSTTSSENLTAVLNSDSVVFIIIAVTFFIVALILITYLILHERKKNRKFKY